LQAQELVLHTASQLQTMSQLQAETGTQVQTELQAQVPFASACSSGFMICTSLSGIFMSTLFDIFGEPFFRLIRLSRSSGRLAIATTPKIMLTDSFHRHIIK